MIRYKTIDKHDGAIWQCIGCSLTSVMMILPLKLSFPTISRLWIILGKSCCQVLSYLLELYSRLYLILRNSIRWWDITWSYFSGLLACEWLYLPVAAYLLWINFKMHGIWQKINQYNKMGLFVKIAHWQALWWYLPWSSYCLFLLSADSGSLAFKFVYWNFGTSGRIDLKASYWKEILFHLCTWFNLHFLYHLLWNKWNLLPPLPFMFFSFNTFTHTKHGFCEKFNARSN
jgi:hypothetical protein